MSQGIGSNYKDYSTNQVNQGENLQATGKTSKGKIVKKNIQEATSINKLSSSSIAKNLADKTKHNFHNRIANFFNKGRKEALDNLNTAYQATTNKNAEAFLKLLKNLSQTSEFKSLPKSTQKIINDLLDGSLNAKIYDKSKSSFHNKIANFFNKGRKEALDNLSKQQTSNELSEFAKSNEFKSLPKSIQQAAIEYAKNTWSIDIDPKTSNTQGENSISPKKPVNSHQNTNFLNELNKKIENKNVQ